LVSHPLTLPELADQIRQHLDRIAD